MKIQLVLVNFIVMVLRYFFNKVIRFYWILIEILNEFFDLIG